MLELIKWSDGKKGSWWGYHTPPALGATCLFVDLHKRSRSDTSVYLCITEKTAALYLKVCQPRERIKHGVWVKPYRQSVKHNRGCEEGHSLSFFSLSTSLYFSTKSLCYACQSRCATCVNI